MARSKSDKSEVSGLLDEIDALIEDFDKQRSSSSALFKEIEEYGAPARPAIDASRHFATVKDAISSHVSKVKAHAHRAFSSARSAISNAGMTISKASPKGVRI